MILHIADIIKDGELKRVQTALASMTYVDGARTAGWSARTVKKNLQAEAGHPQYGELQQLVTDAVWRHALVGMAAWPRAVSPVLFCRYEQGMGYGTHVDNALMGRHGMRSDLSFTLFLSDPDSYTGGELVIDTAQGEERYKLDAGDMLLYPSTFLHRVDAVQAGIRLVAVGWIQSLVRDPQNRELLFDLEMARRSLFDQYGKIREFDLIAKTSANLLRRWAET